MNIIEKLGISASPWKWVDDYGEELQDINGDTVIDDGSAGDEYIQTISMNSPDAQLIAAAPEILEALIDTVIFHKKYNLYPNGIKIVNKNISIIEKATGKTWEEIKGLL